MGARRPVHGPRPRRPRSSPTRLPGSPVVAVSEELEGARTSNFWNHEPGVIPLQVLIGTGEGVRVFLSTVHVWPDVILFRVTAHSQHGFSPEQLGPFIRAEPGQPGYDQPFQGLTLGFGRETAADDDGVPASSIRTLRGFVMRTMPEHKSAWITFYPPPSIFEDEDLTVCALWPATGLRPILVSLPRTVIDEARSRIIDPW